MSKPALLPPVFLLTLFDREQWCPVLQARFEVTDLNRLRSLLGAEGNEDANLDWIYYLDDTEVARLAEAFDIEPDWTALDFPDREFMVDRIHPTQRQPPYLIHTGYELPLLLDGRKKLARFAAPYPPMTFDGEDRFDRCVADGRLHKDVVIETFAAETARELSRKGIQGFRTVYYTPKGEEWRIPAMKLVWDSAPKSGGWNEHLERLEGELFGYEDWQNDWWIESKAKRGGFGGVSLWCAIDDDGLAWIKSAGHRALPPIDRPTLMLDNYDASLPDATHLALRDGGASTIAVFTVRGNGVLNLFKGVEGPPWRLPAARIPELNALLLRSIKIEPVQTTTSD